MLDEPLIPDPDEQLQIERDEGRAERKGKRAQLEQEMIRVSQTASVFGRATFEVYKTRQILKIDHIESDGRIILVPAIDTIKENKYRLYALYLDEKPNDIVYVWVGSRAEKGAKAHIKMMLNTKDAYGEINEALGADEHGNGAKPWHIFALKKGTQAKMKEEMKKLKSAGKVRCKTVTPPQTSEEYMKKRKAKQKDYYAELNLKMMAFRQYVKRKGYDPKDVPMIFNAMHQIANYEEILDAINDHYGIDPTDHADDYFVKPHRASTYTEKDD
jgi:hypothetical protein